eukprot:6112594-Prymnesium_polylepis.1
MPAGGGARVQPRASSASQVRSGSTGISSVTTAAARPASRSRPVLSPPSQMSRWMPSGRSWRRRSMCASSSKAQRRAVACDRSVRTIATTAS